MNSEDVQSQLSKRKNFVPVTWLWSNNCVVIMEVIETIKSMGF